MQRRDFIRNLAVSAIACSTFKLSGAREALPPVGKEGWSGAAFERLQGESFRVRASGGVRRMVLDQVSHRRRPRMESASLRFRGEAKARLAEGSYRFFHRELGELDIFIVPGTCAGDACFYRATFARLI